MANTKISQLPSYTGTAADLRWFVMNNSGQTETFKFSGYTSPLKRVGTDNINNIYDTTAMGGTFGVIIGGSSNTISSGNNNGIFAGTGNVNSSSRGVILGGQNNTLTAFADGVILCGGGNNLGGAYCVLAGNNNTGAGISNFGYGNSININGSFGAIVSGDGNRIVGSGSDYNFIGAGLTNYITTSDYSAIIGGRNNNITSTDYAVMLGTSGRTAAASATTYVENIHSYRTPSTEVQPISSGTTFTCNLNNGAKSQFYITGTSTINITNVRDGASFMIKTQTDGNYNMTWTATGGYTFLFEGGIKDPGNNVIDVFQFEVFGSVIYGNRRHNYS